MAEKTRKGGKKNRKHGRNKVWCEGYRRRGQRLKNKAKRLRKHLDKYPGDRCAFDAYQNCKGGANGPT